MAGNAQLVLLYITVCIAIFSLGLSVYSNSNNAVECAVNSESGTYLKRDEANVDQLQGPTTEQEITRLKGIVQSLMQTLVSYSMMTTQNKRYQASSGITEVRSYGSGTQPYHQVGVTGGRSPMSIHNHANYRTTMGMGEFSAVLNGVEFWTRHNDYKLIQANNSYNYHSTRAIPFPAVPQSVLDLPTVPEQIEEMRQYFKAWIAQDIKIRDYRPYFKASLCYLEGNWIVDSSDLTEPFSSDRHFVDAATWKSLNDKNRFLFASGRKNNLENLPFLPSVIHDIYQQETYVIQAPQVVKDATPIYKSDSFPGDLFRAMAPIVTLPDRIHVILAQTAKGLYLNVILGKSGALTAGGANVTITCDPLNSTGCDSANAAEFCQKELKTCKNFVQGTSPNMKFTWPANPPVGNHPGFVYGPLTGSCFSVTLRFSDVTGLTGATVRGHKTLNVSTDDLSQPITIEGCIGDPLPRVANFEYRVLCSPIERDLKTNRFRVVDDTASQMSQNPPLNAYSLERSRFAYFQLNPRDSDSWTDSQHGYELLDELMETIPGKDNAGASLTEKVGDEITLYYNFSKGVMNTAYYSRFYTSDGTDAMGRQQKRRGFNDPNLFAAMTTQPKIADLSLPDPVTGELIKQKWSYAIPLEIIYTTPLSSWNPYKLAYIPEGGGSDASITANGRDGGFTQARAYNGTGALSYFYWTPVEFFSNTSTDGDAADTSGDTVGVLDVDGVTVRKVRAAGHYITLPPIAGVGSPRQRYPIAPLSIDKNPGFMNARALKHLLATNQKQLLDSKINIGKATLPLWTSPSTMGNRHFHRVNVVGSNVDKWDSGKANVTTTVSEEENGHTHSVTIRRTVNPAGGFFYTITDCDGVGVVCPDGHSKMCLTDQSC